MQNSLIISGTIFPKVGMSKSIHAVFRKLIKTKSVNGKDLSEEELYGSEGMPGMGSQNRKKFGRSHNDGKKNNESGNNLNDRNSMRNNNYDSKDVVFRKDKESNGNENENNEDEKIVPKIPIEEKSPVVIFRFFSLSFKYVFHCFSIFIIFHFFVFILYD